MKIKLTLLTVLLLLIVGRTAYAGEIPPDVRVNGEFIESVSFIKDDKTYAPLRTVAEKLGYKVFWNDGEIIIGETISVKDYVLKDGLSYLPVRNIAEILGAEVSWDGELHIADLKNGIVKDDDSLYWLSRIINAESSGEPLSGKIGVGNVVLNRVRSKEFPNNVKDVVFDKKGGVQFTPVSNGTIHKAPTKSSVLAAKLVLRGENTAGASLFFMNPRISTSSWISRNRKFYKSIQNHDFYL